MQGLIVLGLVPGTHVQITFVAWVVLVSGGALFAFARFGLQSDLFRAWIIANQLNSTVAETELQLL